VQTGISLSISGRKMILLFLFSLIGSVSADACSNPCASGSCASLKEYLSCSEFAELNCDCAGCCSMPPPSMPPPLQHHAPSAPPTKRKVAAAVLTAVAGKKLMDKVPDDLTCSASEVPMCEEIESLEAENIEQGVKIAAQGDTIAELESKVAGQNITIAEQSDMIAEQGDTIAELESKAELLENEVAALKRFVGMMPPAAPPPLSPPFLPPPLKPPGLPVTELQTYCADSVCGERFAIAGWSVLTEFGSLNPPRFADMARQASDQPKMSALGWQSIGDNIGNDFNNPSFMCNGCGMDTHISFFASGYPQATYQMAIPQGTSQLVIAYGGYAQYSCRCDVTNFGGSDVDAYSYTSTGIYNNNGITVAVIDVDTVLGEGDITFTEPGQDVCLLFYIIYM